VWDALEGQLGGCALRRVRLREAAGATYECRGGNEVDVTRTYEFSASHRLHAEGLDDGENRRLFGKCNNPAGHGHNYVLEVTLRGPLDERGELVEEDAFDRVVHAEVVDRWDHRHLNEDVPEFAGVIPTAEEIARVAWERLDAPLRAAAPGARLHRVKLRETARNHVEYYGPGEPEEGAER
ncbi:6-carboxytetrahydropterin synthase, partial [bacterium]|nr:6-carboxytetrahydropterin synthase [bacterium]